MRNILIAGGAGFIGSHLAEAHLSLGDHVVVVDNLSTGNTRNLGNLTKSENLDFCLADVRQELNGVPDLDVIYNLASPASPPAYQAGRTKCLQTNSIGVQNLAELAHSHQARLVQASTSEVYGSPLVHPQKEDYWGNVNPIGDRSCYDEGKRYAEAYLMAHKHEHDTNVGIVRIFNTYGPHMSPYDGRVISNFIRQSLQGEDMTIYGDGTQTRSFCFVSDLVRGLMLMGESTATGPVNLGNPTERTVLDAAEVIIKLTNSTSRVVKKPLPSDDPVKRKPDISAAQEILGWSPETPFIDGVRETIRWFNQEGYGN